VRLKIYRDAYYFRLLEVLAMDYPVLHKLMGCEAFEETGKKYIDAYTSSYRSIRWFGQHLPVFLTQSNTSPDLTWQAEMALFEWLLTEAFDAPDSVVLTLEEMSAVTPEKWPDMCFKLQPCLRKFTANWNIPQLWQTSKEAQTTIIPEKSETSLTWLVWRKEYDIKFCSLTVEQNYMIDAIMKNHTFGDICQGLSQWLEAKQVVNYAAQYLKTIITDGLIAECIA
jgi:hypothetical protein